jgi:hypothetical protein
MSSRKRLLALELLEDRSVPASFGMPWQDPSHLSLSFAPDGTPIAGHQSELFSSLDSQLSTADWQRTILRAFQTWAIHANLNFGIRADEGQAFGVPGLVQGDPRFGDLRIGAHEMTPEVLAISVPSDPALAGTWSGDVFFNSAYSFVNGDYSLVTVALHEAGNALGLADSDNPEAVMYRLYNAARTELAAEDIARIQALYGVRAADSYEGTRGNNTRATASPFQLPTGYKGETPLVAFGDLTTLTDRDFYSFTFPDDGNDDQNNRSVTIRLQTEGRSLLAPKLTILDQFGRVLSRRVSTSVTGDVLQVTLSGLSSQGTYYIRVEAATPDVFGIGSYGLSVRMNNTSSTPDTVIDKLLSGPFDKLGPDAIDAFFRNSGDVLLNAEEGANETPGSATPLTANAGYAVNTRYEAIASLAKKEDVDVYRLVAPTGTSRVLTATVWTADGTGFHPQVSVLDAQGNPVAAQVLTNGNGTSTVQIANSVPGAVYYMKVTVTEQATQDKGNYLVSASFGEVATPLRTFAQGTLSASDRDDSTRLYIATTQLFHFVLTTGNEDPGALVRLRIRDGAGNEVVYLVARAGETISGSSVLLTPGSYLVEFEVENPNGPPISYQLQGSSQSTPIGPVPTDSTMAPQYTTAENPGMFLFPGFTVPYDPTLFPGYVKPGDPSTYPPGFVLPAEYAHYPWLIATTDPYYWIAMGL